MAARKSAPANSALPRIGPPRLKLLAIIVPLLATEFVALAKDQLGVFLVGLGALYLAALAAATAAFTAGRILRGRVVFARIGIGPVVKRAVVGDRLVVWRAVPIAAVGMVLPRPARFGRDWRLISATGIGTYIVLLVVGAFVLPLYGAVAFCWGLGSVVVLTLSTRDPLTGRRVAARLLTRPTPQTDPVLADPRRTAAERAAVDAQFGDFIAAERTLAELRRTSPGPEEGVALLESEILAARGDFVAALRVEIPLAPDASPALAAARTARHQARTAKLLLLAAEQDPPRAAQAVPMARNQLKKLAETPYRSTADRSGRVLLALQTGDAAAAAREARVALALAKTPLTTADALCALAVAGSMQGKAKAARARLDQAARLVPWYPRLTTVQRIISTQAGGAVLPPVDAAADTSSVFDDPWSAPSRD
jgi:hypothetical protein